MFSFSAQYPRIVSDTKKEITENDYFRNYQRNLTTLEISLIALKKDLKKHENLLPEVTLKNAEIAASKIKSIKYLNTKYLATAFALMNVNDNEINSELFNTENEVIKNIYITLLNDLEKKSFDNFTKVKEQIFIYCTLIKNTLKDEDEYYEERRDYDY